MVNRVLLTENPLTWSSEPSHCPETAEGYETWSVVPHEQSRRRFESHPGNSQMEHTSAGGELQRERERERERERSFSNYKNCKGFFDNFISEWVNIEGGGRI